jgi:hypothetical protein
MRHYPIDDVIMDKGRIMHILQAIEWDGRLLDAPTAAGKHRRMVEAAHQIKGSIVMHHKKSQAP